MNFDLIDALYRSRVTLMQFLQLRGYEVDAYTRFSPRDMRAMAVNLGAAGFTVSHKSDDRKCTVIYQQTRLTRKVSAITDRFEEEDKPVPDYEKMDLIVLTMEPIKELHHILALELWTEKKLRTSFFCIYNIISNPMDHIIVPPHERVSPEEYEAVMSKVTSKSQLPVIRFHLDPIGRILGLVPGEIVKITRPSPSAGVYTIYRVCAP
jgi:DNA-directed RNA polymerase subunit H (RpoH/RPB5)